MTSTSQRLRRAWLLAPLQVMFRLGEAAMPLALVHKHGSGRPTDAFNLLWTFALFASAAIFALFRDSAFVPALVAARAEANKATHLRGRLLWHALQLGMLGGAGLWIACVVAAPGDSWLLRVGMSLPLALYVPMLSVRTALVTVLQAESRFFVGPALGGLSMAVPTLALLLTGVSPLWLPWWLAAGEAMSLAFTGLWVARTIPLNLRAPAPLTEASSRLWQRVGLESAGRFVTRVNPAVDQMMVRSVPGAITAMRLSADISGAAGSLLQMTFLPVLLTQLSLGIAQGDRSTHRRHTCRALFIVGATLALGAAAAFVWRHPLLQLLLGHGAMTEPMRAQVEDLFGFHLLGVPFLAMQLVAARALTAADDGAFLLPVGLGGVALNVVANLCLWSPLGAAGIALSTSLVGGIAFAFMMARLLWLWRAPCLPLHDAAMEV